MMWIALHWTCSIGPNGPMHHGPLNLALHHCASACYCFAISDPKSSRMLSLSSCMVVRCAFLSVFFFSHPSLISRFHAISGVKRNWSFVSISVLVVAAWSKEICKFDVIFHPCRQERGGTHARNNSAHAFVYTFSIVMTLLRNLTPKKRRTVYTLVCQPRYNIEYSQENALTPIIFLSRNESRK